MMLVEPDFSQYGMILEPLWSCLSKGEDTVREAFSSALAGSTAQPRSNTTSATASNIGGPAAFAEPVRPDGDCLRLILAITVA